MFILEYMWEHLHPCIPGCLKSLKLVIVLECEWWWMWVTHKLHFIVTIQVLVQSTKSESKIQFKVQFQSPVPKSKVQVKSLCLKCSLNSKLKILFWNSIQDCEWVDSNSSFNVLMCYFLLFLINIQEKRSILCMSHCCGK